MIKLICTVTVSLSVLSCFSQVNISPNILASPFQGDRFIIKANSDIQGTPLLFENWKSGQVSLENGELYEIKKINFNASNSKFIYSLNDTLYEIQDNVKQVKIFNENNPVDSTAEMLFRSDILPGQSQFVQILTKSKITILRQFSKKPEGENYSNGIVNETRKYVLHTQDIALVNGKVIPLTYSSAALNELISDKKTDVNAYVKSNHLKLKKESDFLQAINFYNSLQ